jgi:hypothetical protein
LTVAEVSTNLRVLKRSRTQPNGGDVFAMQLPDGRYLFGQVVGANLPVALAPTEGAYLIYIYDVVAGSDAPVLAALTPDRLLIPPLFINKMPWTKGYFQNIAHRPLTPGTLLPHHCFRDPVRNGYIDERRQPLTAPIEPCGQWALRSYRRLDDLISDALGIPRAPD